MKMISEEIKRSIEKSVLCWLATSSKENFPNVSPKEIFTYYGNSKVIIAAIASPQTVKNICSNPNVCVSFIDVFVQKGYQIKGKAEIVNEKQPLFTSMFAELVKIAGEKITIRAIISIEVTSVKPIIAPSYHLFPDVTEGEQVLNAMKTYKVRPE